MLQSMTGFVSKSIILEPEINHRIKLTINIKSLNSRYFDINSKLPYALSQFETDFIKIIKSKLHRGNIFFTIHLSDTNAFKASIEPAIFTISGYVEAINKIKEKFNLSENVSLKNILTLPNIFTLEEKGIDTNSKEIIFNTIYELLNELVDERLKEGLSLQNDIEERIKLMQEKIENIEKLSKIAIEEQKEKIAKKITELNAIENQTLVETQKQSLYMTLDKMDIHEEIVRFKSHLKNFKEVIYNSAQEKGKQLDFILQELAREINTISAKISNAQITENVISIKVEIEKAREQVQNIV